MKTSYRHHWGGGGAFLLAAFAALFLAASAQAGGPIVESVSVNDLANTVSANNSTYSGSDSVTFNLSGSGSLTAGLVFSRPDDTTLSGTYTFNGNGYTITGTKTGVSAFNNYDSLTGNNPAAAPTGNGKAITGVKEFVFRNLTITGAIKENTVAGGPGGGAIQMSGQIKSSLTVNQEAYNHRVDITLDGVTLDGNKVVASGAGPGSIAAAGGLIINGGGSGVSLTNNFKIINNEVLASMTGGGHFVYGGGLRVFNTNGITVGNGDITGNKAVYSGGSNDSWVIGGGAAIELDTDIAVQESVVTFTNTKIERNTASNTAGTGGYAQGGGLYLGGNIDAAANASLAGNKALSTTLTGVTLSDNEATAGGSNSAYGGAIAQNGGAATRINAGTTISGNKAIADAGNAKGGGIYASNLWENVAHPLANLTIESTTFTNNSATSTSGAAQGGAIWSNFAFTDTGSTFTGNTATGNATHGGQGGAIWSAGDVTLTNSKLTGNSATGTNAAGGAVYMDTAGGPATLNLVATAGGKAEFSGNYTGTATNLNSIHFGGTGAGTLNVNADATGSVHILDPISANTTGLLTVEKRGAGNFTWGGTNVIEADTTVNIIEGSFTMSKDYSLSVTSGKSMNVSIASGTTLTFDAMRDKDTALFDFTNATGAGGKSLTVGASPKPTLTAMSSGAMDATGTVGARPVHGFTEADYVLVRGLTEAQASDFVTNIDWESNKGSNANRWTYINELGWESDPTSTGKIVANAGYNSPFENSGGNAFDAHNVFDDLVNNERPNFIGDDEWKAMQNNARAITPEIAMQATNVMLDGVARVQSTAVDYAVRTPHRLRMRMEDSYTRRSYRPAARRAAPAAAGTATATTDPVTGETMIYQQGMLTPGIENYQAYPAMRLEDCYFPGVGLRIWAGYTGEWRRQRERGGLSGYDTNRHGVLLGVNYDIGTVASVGVYGGYTNADVDARGYDAELDADNGHFGIIGRVSPLATMPELSFYADAGYHFANNDSVRQMQGAAVMYDATGSFDQDVWTFGLGAEYVIRTGMFNITPQADVRFSHLSQDDFTEGGNSNTVTHLDGVTADQFYHRLGVEFSYDYLFAGGVVTPALSLGWKHDWVNRRHHSSALYVYDVTNPTAFNVAATPPSRDSVDIGVALKSVYNITSSTKLGVNLAYNLNLGGRSHSHAVYAGVELGF